MSAVFSPCAVIPSFNHWRAAGAVIAAARRHGLPVFVVDDGSDEPARSALAALHDPAGGVTVRRLAENQGKGAAVMAGFEAATAAGHSHAVQIDADGQHDLAALDRLIDLARERPEALVTGTPVYDASIPRGRAIGRWITHVWVWIETLSFQIRDSMCGFRVYPLAAVARLRATGTRIGRRMDFDTEIMVRLFWQGTPIAATPVRVTYPPDNTSNFDLWRDNVRISAMHSRLVGGMLWRLPAILRRRAQAGTHWAGLTERGLLWGLRFCAGAYRLLGRRAALALITPVILYFYLTGPTQRRASRDFLVRAFASLGIARRPGFRDGLRHFRSFAGRALDVFAAWNGDLDARAVARDGVAALDEAEARAEGAVFVISHLGNIDAARATLSPARRRRMIVLVHTRHAENYNRLLRELNPEAAVNLMQVTDIGPAMAIRLQEEVERGAWIFIAGDRTPIGSERVSLAPFLGHPAPFSQGPFVLAAIMGCPVYAMFCLREGRGFRLHAEKLAERIVLPRRGREAVLAGHVAAYAALLEREALLDPFQWYNFFDFWPQRESAGTS